MAPATVSMSAPSQRWQVARASAPATRGSVHAAPRTAALRPGASTLAGVAVRHNSTAVRLAASRRQVAAKASASSSPTAPTSETPAWLAVWQSFQRMCKNMMAAAAACWAFLVGQSFLAVAPAMAAKAAAPAAVEASSPMMDSYALTMSSKALGAKIEAMIANPVLSIFPIVCLVAVYILFWGLKSIMSSGSDEATAATPVAAAPVDPANDRATYLKDKLTAYRQRAQQRVKAMDDALAVGTSSAAMHAQEVMAKQGKLKAASAAAASDKSVQSQSPKIKVAEESTDAKYLMSRMRTVRQSFPTAAPMDDFLLRLEAALGMHGFNGENSIGMVNLCRDEATNAFKQKIEAIFPLAFNTNGLGGGLTLGVTGMGAGLSHSPTDPDTGKKRYIFFSFPHIAIDVNGKAGPLARPGQQACNSACGAMLGALGQLSAPGGVEAHYIGDNEHEVENPEYSMLKQRIALRVTKEELSMDKMDLVELTKVAERQISDDLANLISKAVDPKTADYAVITGIQVHNWGTTYDNEEPNLEFVAPTSVTVVTDGKEEVIDLTSFPAYSPRMIRKLTGICDDTAVAYTGDATVSALPVPVYEDLEDVEQVKESNEEVYERLLAQLEQNVVKA